MDAPPVPISEAPKRAKFDLPICAAAVDKRKSPGNKFFDSADWALHQNDECEAKRPLPSHEIIEKEKEVKSQHAKEDSPLFS